MPTKEFLRTWGYGDPDEPGYASKYIVTFTEAGLTMNVHRGLVPVFRNLIRGIEGFGIDLSKGIRDDWSYLNKGIEGYPAIYKSWHSVGGAVDLDATKNPMGVDRTTFPVYKTRLLCQRLGLTWGYFWSSRPDPMHFEVAKPLPEMIRISKRLKAQRG